MSGVQYQKKGWPKGKKRGARRSWDYSLGASVLVSVSHPKIPKEKYDWSKASSMPLHQIYQGARGLKNSVLRRWMDNLQLFLTHENAHIRAEAMRRIEYISEHLIHGPDDIEEPTAPPPVTVRSVAEAMGLPANVKMWTPEGRLPTRPFHWRRKEGVPI